VQDFQRILIFNPYAGDGGGKEIQSSFRSVIGLACPKAIIEEYCPNTGRSGHFAFSGSYSNSRNFSGRLRGVDLIILQGLFNPGAIPLARYARKSQVPYIVVPRGDFIPGRRHFLVSRSPLRKWIVWLTFARERINNAGALVVTSKLELDRLEAVGARTDHAYIIPDPLPGGTLRDDFGSAALTKGESEKNGKLFVLFLGRFSTEKNLPFLVKLWPEVLKSVPQAQLILAGPVNHQNVMNEVNRLISVHAIANSVKIIPWLSGEEKKAYLARARCLVLPSLYESFGLTVVEALTNATPCLVSDGTPWTDLPPPAGYCLPLDPSIWISQLTRYLISETKVEVPKVIARDLLAPFALDNVAKSWRSVIQAVLTGKSS
jgi:glycosyltransferase involved in cell wall biosynthesis